MSDPTPDDSHTRPTGPTRIEVITPNEASTTAFGEGPLSPETRTPAAQSGYAQGRTLAPTIRRMWLEA
ncbi:hypothetical protein [Embleya sp. AB8]|uniref:hypothetical protein n=1 Tax=Embleya sp. AB8 TaxID=3156304 RepID=UPI003C72C22A